jgi:gluconate 2-dehydrogenase gamma chain
MIQVFGLHHPVLTQDERLAIAKLLEAILPGDETTPGATDAGAIDYVDGLLGLGATYYWEIPTWLNAYKSWVPLLDAEARSRFQVPLRDCNIDQATSIVADLAQNKLQQAPQGQNQKAFFMLLRAHCIEACFADPRWGGNRDGVMWKYVGYIVPTKPFRRIEGARGGDEGHSQESADGQEPDIWFQDLLEANPPAGSS